MLKRTLSHIRRQPLALLALFLAVGGGGAFAAGQLGGAETRGYNVVVTNGSGTKTGTLAKLGGLTLTYSSRRLDEGRFCQVNAKASGKGEVHSFTVAKPNTSAAEYRTRSHTFKGAGSYSGIAFASFDEGVPGISRQLEGQITWRSAESQSVATSVLHLSAESKRCAFFGTLTSAG